MCTLIVLHSCVPETPLAIGANRDEFFERPAEGPALRNTEFGAIVAPRDVRAGGTWLGMNEHGLFAAVTNRPTQGPDPQRRSRGLLVLDALANRSAIEAMEKLEQLPAQAYNPFNLLVADRESVHAITYDETPRGIDLPRGPIVIGNADPDGARTPKLERLSARAAELVQTTTAADVLDGIAGICRSHDDAEGPLTSACVHAGEYGTRSSALIRFGANDCEFRFTDAPPCASDYRDYTPLLRRLGDGSRV